MEYHTGISVASSFSSDVALFGECKWTNKKVDLEQFPKSGQGGVFVP